MKLLDVQVRRIISKVRVKTNELLYDTLKAGHKLHVLAGSDKYFIVDQHWEVNLALGEASCSCGQYADTGLPCEHMAAAFLQPRKPGSEDFPDDLSEYTDPYYRLETLAKIYKEVIVPCVAGRDLEPDGIVTLPQADVPQAGRPRRNVIVVDQINNWIKRRKRYLDAPVATK